MRPASLRLFISFLSSIGLVSYVFAEPTPNSNFGVQAKPTNSAPDSASSSQSNSGSSQDDQTNIAGTDGDGLPVLKRKPGAEHEKIIQLKDGQKLPTSGVDPKFQGSLLNTSVDSIVSVSPQADKNRGAGNKEPRSKKSDLSVTKESSDSQKKNGSSSARSDENPTPTPSATVPAATKTSSDRKP
jgi:hypothetical protein